MSKCTCKEWGPQIQKVNGPITLQSIRAGRDLYDGVPFRYCPWCGDYLLEQLETEEERVQRLLLREQDRLAHRDGGSL